MLDNKIYDILKWIALIALPALATLIDLSVRTGGSSEDC